MLDLDVIEVCSSWTSPVPNANGKFIDEKYVRAWIDVIHALYFSSGARVSADKMAFLDMQSHVRVFA